MSLEIVYFVGKSDIGLCFKDEDNYYKYVLSVSSLKYLVNQ